MASVNSAASSTEKSSSNSGDMSTDDCRQPIDTDKIESFFGPGYLSSERGFAHEILSRLNWTENNSSVSNWREKLAKQAGGALSPMDAVDVEQFAPTPEQVLREFEALQRDSLFLENSSLLMSPQSRYKRLSQVPVGGFLAVVRLWQSPCTVLANGTRRLWQSPLTGQANGTWTKPFLTVLGMPSVVERGTPVVAEHVWPGETFLSPGAVPRPDGPMLPIALTLASDTREEPKRGRSRSSYIEDPATVWCLDGYSALELVGCVPSRISAMDRGDAGSLAPLWDTHAQLSVRVLDNTAFRSDVIASDTVCCTLPRVLMLPETHDLPIGQIWDPTVGFERFLHSIEYMAGNSATSPVLWYRGTLFREWFARVESHLEEMAIDVVPRSAIAASLLAQPPMDDSLAQNASDSLKFLDNLLAYRLHRDWILASNGDVKAYRRIYLQYEERAWTGSFPMDAYMGGSPAPLCADMWYLRPPAIPMWWDLMKLNSFMEDEAVAPSAHTYAQHRILPGEPAPRIAIDTDSSPDRAVGPRLRLSSMAPASERRTLTASMISHRFLQAYVEESVEEIPLSPEMWYDPNQSHKPFNMDAKPRDKDGVLHRYGRQVLLGLVLASAATFGLLFSTFGNKIGLHDRERQPFLFSFIQWVAMIIVFPHWIPTIASIYASEPPHKFFRSNVPITLRWVTRGDANAATTLIAVEAVNKMMRDQGLDNFRIEIVTDGCVAVDMYDCNGDLKMNYDLRTRKIVACKKQVKAPLVVKQELGLLPDYVSLVVCPDNFRTRCGTVGKSRALFYASLRNKIIRSRKEFGEKVNRIMALFNSGKIERARYKIACLFDESNDLREELVQDLGEQNYYYGRRATQELIRLEEVFDGRVLDLSWHLVRLPKFLNKLFTKDLDLFATAMYDLQYWSVQVPLNEEEEDEFEFCKLDSQVLHLNEDSFVSSDILWSLNENSQKGEMSWRLLQGQHTYADACSTLGLSCAGLQARIVHLWNAICVADDCHRWVTQLCLLQRVVIGAKGSSVKLSQAVEQKRGFGFNGGKSSNFAEGTHQAFNVAPAIEQLRREIEVEMEHLSLHYSSETVLHSYENESKMGVTFGSTDSLDTVNGVSMKEKSGSLETSSERIEDEVSKKLAISGNQKLLGVGQAKAIMGIGHRLSSHSLNSMRSWLADVVFDINDIVRMRGASLLLKEGIQCIEKKLNARLEELSQLPGAMREKAICEITMELLRFIDEAHTDCLGWKDAYWLTGKVREQSPSSLGEFVFRRRRRFAGLLSIWSQHKYLGKDGQFMARWGSMVLVIIGLVLMPFALLTLAITLISTLALDKAAEPLTAVVATSIYCTYIYMYGYGLCHLFRGGVYQTLGAFLCWVTCFAQITSWIVETPANALAFFAPDTEFVEVPTKDRAVVDFVFENDVYSDAMKNLKAREEYETEMVSEAYDCYFHAAVKAGPAIHPLSREEFMAALPMGRDRP